MPVDFFDGIQPSVDFVLINQRLFQKGSEHTGPHGSFCLVQNPEKRTPLAFFPHGFCQFQITSGGTVNEHILIGNVGGNSPHVFQ